MLSVWWFPFAQVLFLWLYTHLTLMWTPLNCLWYAQLPYVVSISSPCLISNIMAVVGAFVIQPFRTVTGNNKLYWQRQKEQKKPPKHSQWLNMWRKTVCHSSPVNGQWSRCHFILASLPISRHSPWNCYHGDILLLLWSQSHFFSQSELPRNL